MGLIDLTPLLEKLGETNAHLVETNLKLDKIVELLERQIGEKNARNTSARSK